MGYVAPLGHHYTPRNLGKAKYTEVEALEDRIVEYFVYIQGEEEEYEFEVINKDGTKGVEKAMRWKRIPEEPTITGLTLFLGFSSKTTLYEYRGKPEFKAAINFALTQVEHSYEKELRGKDTAGIKFALNAFGWSEKITTTNVNFDGEVGKLTPEQIKEISDALDKDV